MRLFAAIDIDQKLRQDIAGLQQRIKQQMKNANGLKWVEPKNLHITIKFFGDLAQEKAEKLPQIIEQSCKGKNDFQIKLHNIGCIGRPPKILWLADENSALALVHLKKSLENNAAKVGIERDNRKFCPHLTLARVKDRYVAKNLMDIVNNFGRIELPPIKVNSLGLYKSKLTDSGPIYTLLQKTEFGKQIAE